MIMIRSSSTRSYDTRSNSSFEQSSLAAHLEEMHPIAFRLAFGLTHEAAAEELGLEPQTMRSYLRKTPSRRVRKLAATIAKRWLEEGRSLTNPQYLAPHLSTHFDTKDFRSMSR